MKEVSALRAGHSRNIRFMLQMRVKDPFLREGPPFCRSQCRLTPDRKKRSLREGRVTTLKLVINLSLYQELRERLVASVNGARFEVT